MKPRKTHILERKPYAIFKFASGDIPIYKSLCGNEAPSLYAFGAIKPTCKTCIRISNQKTQKETL